MTNWLPTYTECSGSTRRCVRVILRSRAVSIQSPGRDARFPLSRRALADRAPDFVIDAFHCGSPQGCGGGIGQLEEAYEQRVCGVLFLKTAAPWYDTLSSDSRFSWPAAADQLSSVIVETPPRLAGLGNVDARSLLLRLWCFGNDEVVNGAAQVCSRWLLRH